MIGYCIKSFPPHNIVEDGDLEVMYLGCGNFGIDGREHYFRVRDTAYTDSIRSGKAIREWYRQFFYNTDDVAPGQAFCNTVYAVPVSSYEAEDTYFVTICEHYNV